MIRQSDSSLLLLWLILFGSASLQVFAVVLEIPVYIAGQKTPYSIRYQRDPANGRELVKYHMVNMESWDYQSLKINSDFKCQNRIQELNEIFSNAKEFELDKGSTPCFFSLWSMHSQQLQREIIDSAASVSQKVKNGLSADNECVLFPLVPLFFCDLIIHTEIPAPKNGFFISRVSLKKRVISYVQASSDYFATGAPFDDDKISLELEIRLKECGNFDALNINFTRTGKSWVPDSVARVNPYQTTPKEKARHLAVNRQPFAGVKKETSALPEYCLPCSGVMFCCPLFIGCVICGGLIYVHSSFSAIPFTVVSCLIDDYNVAVTLSAGCMSTLSKLSAGAGICSMATGACGSGANVLSGLCCIGNRLRKYCSASNVTDNDLSKFIGQLAVTPYNYDVYLRRLSESSHLTPDVFGTSHRDEVGLPDYETTTTEASVSYIPPDSSQPIHLQNMANVMSNGNGGQPQTAPFQGGGNPVVRCQPPEDKKRK